MGNVGEDGYDWSIRVAFEHHNSLGLEQVSEDEASASEPFSRNESEFTFVVNKLGKPEKNTESGGTKMSLPKLEVEGASHSLHCYIAADNGSVSSIVLYVIVSKPTGDIWLGAYYGAVGGGESDGGYFILDIEGGSSKHLDYHEVEELSESEPSRAAELEAVMQALWTLVDDDDGDMTVSSDGSNHYSPDSDGIWNDANFDGDSLDDISKQWKIRLTFES